MKEYKVDLSMYEGRVREVLSSEVQKKAFELGYEWVSVGKEVSWLKSPYLFFNKGGIITYLDYEDVCHFEDHSGIEIKAADFLSLTSEDVQDKPKEPEFKPFDRVLVRDFDGGVWNAHLYSHLDESCTYIHRTVGEGGYNQCIPYEGNEHLLGTTGEPE
jgi:hypothetical protein